MLWAGLLAGIAGYIDAICFLRLGYAFATNMTGNLVHLGMDAASANWPKAAWIAAILCAYVLGVVLARLLARAHFPSRAVLLLEALLIIPVATGRLGLAAVPLLAALMAMQNETVTHGIVTVNVTFVTGDIQVLGEQLATGDSIARRNFRRPASLIVPILICYAIGAAGGALASRWGATALLAAIAVLCLTALLPERWARLPFRET